MSSSSHSPYHARPVDTWLDVTRRLLEEHPLEAAEVVEVVLRSWDDVFATRIGRRKFSIGNEIKPSQHIMGFLLHELIPLELSRRYPRVWRPQASKNEKDIVHIEQPVYSMELKTSSNPRQVFGNRSYGQPTKPAEVARKGKFGYYLTINCEPFRRRKGREWPRIVLVRFGWLDHDDWIPQSSQTGQQARLRPEAYDHKLRIIYQASSDSSS